LSNCAFVGDWADKRVAGYLHMLSVVTPSERFSHPLRTKPGRSGSRASVDPSRNNLLAAVPHRWFDLQVEQSNVLSFPQGEAMQTEHEEVASVYFPLSGMVSLLVVMKDGRTVESAVIGREGVTGARAGLGLHTSVARVVAQLPMSALVISAIALRKLVSQSDEIQDLCVKSTDTLLKQVSVTAACNSLHVVEARFCRWLLHTSDRAESD